MVLIRNTTNSAISSRTQMDAMQANLEAVVGRMNEMEAQRVRDREELLSKLSARTTELLKQQAPPSRPRAHRRSLPRWWRLPRGARPPPPR